MFHTTKRFLPALLTVSTAICVGCQTTGVFVVSRLALQKPPLAIAVVVDPAPTTAIAPFNPFNSYLPLQIAMADDLGQPVSVDSCFAFQAAQGLANGWYAAAVVSPAQFAGLSPESRARVLAVTSDRGGRVLQTGLLIAAESSRVSSIADLRGSVVAFGPSGDALTHHAALQLLRESGVARESLALEVLPVPGSLKHFPNAKAVAQSVLNGSSAAGFIDELAWNEMPESGSDSSNPARTQFRVIGRTIALPARLIVASPKLYPRTADRMQAFLLRVGTRKPDVARSLDLTGYAEADADVLAACAKLLPESSAARPLSPTSAGAHASPKADPTPAP